MGKRCPEDFNPWPPFVDIFASVILVMLLFLLITIVNIGYYAQFKYKMSYSASTVTPEPVVSNEQTKVTTTAQKQPEVKQVKKDEQQNEVSFHKIKEPTFKDANNSLFSGGKSEGNAVSYAANKTPKEFTNQQAVQQDLSLSIHFKDKEIFVSTAITSQIKRFISQIQRRSKNALFTIYVSDPKNMISSTLAKQVSLGRVLNIKTIIKRANVNPKNIKLNLLQEESSQNPFGDIIIKAQVP
ncbi:MAG: hypothetical protein JXQ67_06245 [Campylobacterales bacterium]|nr:hypothetical protein [Campylobacterales bacterium]